jgi:hypothetical protein
MSSSSRVAILFAVARSCRSGSASAAGGRFERCRRSGADIRRFDTRKAIRIESFLDAAAFCSRLQIIVYNIVYNAVSIGKILCGAFAGPRKMLKGHNANNAGAFA